MEMYRLNEQTGPIRYVAHPRILLSVVIVIILLMLPILVTRAVQMSEHMQTARLDVTDDQTWVIAQLEVDYLKLALAVSRLGSVGSDSVSGVMLLKLPQDVLDRFDIFYSRVGTVSNRIKGWSEDSDRWDKSLQILDRLNHRRNALAAMMDRSGTPGGEIWLDVLEASMADIATDVRELSVTTLTNLSSQATERRLNHIAEQRTLLVQSVTMVVVMGAISLVVLVLYRQVGLRAAAERRLSENLYRVFNAKPDAILITDSNRAIVWQNTAAATLLGENESQGPGPHTLDYYFPGLQRRARKGSAHTLECGEQRGRSGTFRDIIRRADRGLVAAEVTRIPMMAESGDTTTALFVRDISETQRALRALRRERRLAETEAARYQRFLAVMSHEIRSPLHAIMASLDLARQRPEAAALADLHAIAMDAARIALQEADAVLENGRAEHEMDAAEPGVFMPSKILAALAEMNGPTALNAGTRLAVEIGPGADSPILGLRACFWHAVANLLANAVKFTRDGTIKLRLSRIDDVLRVEVADTGPGIPSELQQVIFRDHYTRNPVSNAAGKGAGLGLGLFVEAVQAMSGQHGLESVVGKGSTFWFSFPAPAVEQTTMTEPQALPVFGELPSHLKVLVVDDSHVNRTLIQQMFSSLGLKADVAESGIEAVKMAQAFSYDLILMDLSMPNMDGFAAAAEIRREGTSKWAVIVALTANVLARQVVDKAGSDFDGFLLKPLRLEELRSWLTGALHHAPTSPGDLPPVIDRRAAQDLLDTLPRAIIEALLKAFFDEIEDLEEQLDSGNLDDGLSAKFHKVAGSAGMLGAGRLRELSLEGETVSRSTKQGPSPAFLVIWRQTVADTSRDWGLLLERKSKTSVPTH